MSTWVYLRSEPGLWTTGFYAPAGTWHTDTDHGSSEEAAERVRWLNGASSVLAVRDIEMERLRADNTRWMEQNERIAEERDEARRVVAQVNNNHGDFAEALGLSRDAHGDEIIATARQLAGLRERAAILTKRVRYAYDGDAWDGWLVTLTAAKTGTQATVRRDNGEDWVVMARNITEIPTPEPAKVPTSTLTGQPCTHGADKRCIECVGDDEFYASNPVVGCGCDACVQELADRIEQGRRPVSDRDDLADVIDPYTGDNELNDKIAGAILAAGWVKPPLEQLRRQHLDHAAIRAVLERADGEWGEETGDGPAAGLYLDHLTAAVAKWNQPKETT